MIMRSAPVTLENGYAAEFDTVDKHEWDNIIDKFSDANLYQTWSYEAVRCGEKNISHLVLRSADKIVAVAQARIVRLPVIGLGAAYIRWGPLWQMRNESKDAAVFRNALRALRNEYVCRRRLILRIFPILYDDSSELYFQILKQEGYTPTPKESPQRTLILDIRPPMEQIRKNFKQKWRNCLNRAERNQLELTEGTDDSLFGEFIAIYRELLQRKKFEEPNDINEFRRIQQDLPSHSKMGIFLCRSNGSSSAGAIFTAVGETGLYLFGATNDRGMKDKGSYLLQWKAVQWMKDNGCRFYNLNGINPSVNPGSYHFKAGVSGKTGKDVGYLGRFDCYKWAIAAKLVSKVNPLLPTMKKILNKAK